MKKNLQKVRFLALVLVTMPFFRPDFTLAESRMPIESRWRSIGFAEFMSGVGLGNVMINTKKLDVESAQVNIEAMSQYNFSPSLSYSWGSHYLATPYEPFISPASNSVSLYGTIEGFGKREARERYSRAEAERQQLEYFSTKGNTEFEAALAYVDALRSKRLSQIYQVTLNELSKLDAHQAEEAIKENRNLQLSAARDLHHQALGLINFLGNDLEGLPDPYGSLNVQPQEFQLAEVLDRAMEKRIDLKALNASLISAQHNVRLVERNRNIDFGVGLSFSDTPGYQSGGYSYGRTQTLGFSVSFPLPIQSSGRSELKQASNYQTQMELSLRELRTRIFTEVNQTHLRYVISKEQLADAIKVYDTPVRQQSRSTLEAILDVRDKEIGLLDAQTVHMKALLNFYKAAGITDLPKL